MEREAALAGAALLAAVGEGASRLPTKMRAIAAFVSDSPAEFIRMTSREVCARLGTSEPTLIRFCRSFGHGGLAEFRIELALALASSATGGAAGHPLTSDRRRSNPEGKRRIAAAALALLGPEQSLLIDNGSTAEAFAETLAGDGGRAGLTIMTSGLNVAERLMAAPAHRVMLTGGLIRPPTASLTGRLAEASLAGMHFDLFVMGADSIDPDAGISTYSEDEAHVTRAMLGAASRAMVLADHTEFRGARLHRICALARVHVVVTDRAPPPALAEAIAAAGVRLVVAAPAIPAAARAAQPEPRSEAPA